VSLDLIEMGNEIDFYSNRPKGWNPYEWAAEWSVRSFVGPAVTGDEGSEADARNRHGYGVNLSVSFGMAKRSTKFQIGALGGWTVDNFLQTGTANTDLQEYVSVLILMRAMLSRTPKPHLDAVFPQVVSLPVLKTSIIGS
jgi:hypothetical protein